MSRGPYIPGNAFAEAKAAIEELLLLYREQKQKQQIKCMKHATLQCQPQANPTTPPLRAHTNFTIPTVQPSTALFSLPSELKEKVCATVADEVALSMLAQTCKFLSTFVEEFRFANVVNVLSPRGLASFRTCLSNLAPDRFGRTRIQRVRSLTLSWTGGLPTPPSTAADLEWVLMRLPDVRALSIDIPTLHPASIQGNYRLLPSVSMGGHPMLRTFHTTASLARCFQVGSPVPSLTCLTLDMVRGSADVGVYTVVSALFGSTLRRAPQLRSGLQTPVSGEDMCRPANAEAGVLGGQRYRADGVCIFRMSAADEVQLVCAEQDNAGLMDVDIPEDGMMMAAAMQLPALETLVWAPAWRSAYFDRIRDFERAFRRFQCHLLAVLEPITLHLCVSDTRALMSFSEEGRTWYVSEELVDVDRDEWKNDTRA